MSKEYIDKEKFNRTLDYSFWLDASAIAPSGKEILKKVRRLLKEEPAADVASVTINEYGRLVIDVSNIKDIMHGRAFEIYFGKGDDEKDE